MSEASFSRDRSNSLSSLECRAKELGVERSR